jgi:urease accessory protein
MWLASPALPVGGFSYSEGLEAAVDSGQVTDEAGTARWLLSQWRIGLARADLPAAAAAFAAWRSGDLDAAAAVNDWVRCTRETSELRLQAEQMGRSLVEWLRNGPDADDPRLAALAALKPAPTWPVAFGLATAFTGADARAALQAFAFGWAENMVQAACKAVPLGQAAAQRVLGQLVAAMPRDVDAALATPFAQAQAFAPMLAILSSRHETQYSRLFRS